MKFNPIYMYCFKGLLTLLFLNKGVLYAQRTYHI